MSSWTTVHERGVALGKRRARVEYEELCWMEDALAVQAHLYVGAGSFGAYVAAVLGYDARTARERVSVMERLRELPRVAEAWRDGELLWGSVREVARVAVPQTDAEWVEVARGKSGRTVQQMVSGLVPGDRPGAPKKAEAEDAVLRFEVKASTKAMFVEAQRKLQRDGGRSLDDDELLLTMARAVLEGPRELGRASYQVQMTVCEGCGTGWQQAGGDQVVVEPPAVEAAMCDAHLLPSLQRPAGPVTEWPTRPTELRPAGPVTERPAGPVTERPAGPATERPAGPATERPTGPVAERPAGPAGERRQSEVVVSAMSADEAVAGFGARARLYMDVARAAGRKRSGEPIERATQVLPKRLRERVIRRDGRRCAVPGCNNHAWLDVHHTEPLGEGGTHDPELLVTLCGAHHRAAHEDRLMIEGRHTTGFRFTYPDGRPVGTVPPHPALLDKLQTVTSVLRTSGFKMKEANDAVARIRSEVTADMPVEDMLRAAFRQLA